MTKRLSKRKTMKRKTMKRNTMKRKTMRRKSMRRKSFKKMRGGIGGNCHKYNFIISLNHAKIVKGVEEDGGITKYKLSMNIDDQNLMSILSFSEIRNMLKKYRVVRGESTKTFSEELGEAFRIINKGRNRYFSISKTSCEKRITKINEALKIFAGACNKYVSSLRTEEIKQDFIKNTVKQALKIKED